MMGLSPSWNLRLNPHADPSGNVFRISDSSWGTGWWTFNRRELPQVVIRVELHCGVQVFTVERRGLRSLENG